MQLKDYITLTISLIALAVSLYNFYVQQLRRKERLVGSMISIGINDGKRDRKMEYSVSNVGDVQIVVKEAEFSTNGSVVNAEVVGLPVVLKPGEIALFDILYNSSEVESNSTEVVEIGVFSALGKGYRLPHTHKEQGKEAEGRWNVFKLQPEHEGF
ncbi:hypothetical protein ACJJIR_12645 [Microbulbifer sp. SSSA008]|uniref:hypothetical protein n=1 Tax=Microbulbifer sp. SSSA008 TaxID=3243380 RepID=UPI004038FC33